MTSIWIWIVFGLGMLAQVSDLIITIIGSNQGYDEGNDLVNVKGYRKWLGKLWPFAGKIPVYIAIGVALYIGSPTGILVVGVLALAAGVWASWHNLQFMKENNPIP